MIPDFIKLSDAPTPELALVVYSNGEVSRHPILLSGQQQVIGAGMLLSSEALRVLMQPYSEDFALATESKLRDFIPANVFCKSFTCLGWSVPARQANMWFSGNKAICVNNVPWPNLVFFARKSEGSLPRLSVFSFTEEKLSAETELYHAPLMNINSQGGLCFGSATVPESIDLSAMEDFESAIYKTKFSHVNHQNTINIEGGDGSVSSTQHLKFWQSLSSRTYFPIEALVPAGKIVADLLK